MSLLPKNTCLGKLSYFEIYDDFEGPKCFSVTNSLGQIYLVYWAGDDKLKKQSSWIYSPLSHSRLDDLRRNLISVRDVFTTPEQCVFSVTHSFNGRRSEAVEILIKDLNNYNLPPKEFYIQPDEVEVYAEEAKWAFELKISKAAKKDTPVERGMVTRIIDSFSEVIESLMKKQSREVPKLFPLTAQFGSFEVKVGASDDQMALNALENIDKLFKDFNNLDAYLVDIGLDPHRLKDLVDLLNKDNLKIQVLPKFYDVMGEGFSIGDKKLDEIIGKLESSTITFIDSTKVPQANDIYKVIDIVSKRKDGMPINHENIDGLTSDRQVKYYTDAAYCLGLLNKNTTITAAGRTLCYRDNLKAKLEFLADRFESSDFGIAWMRWAKVTTMMQLNAEDSELFIEQCVKGLNDATAKRRSTTLKSWLNELKGHRREYQDQ